MEDSSPQKVTGMELEEKLDKEDYRITKQRRAIIDILLQNSSSHLSVEQIYQLALNKDKKMGIATIYRNLKLLEKLNLVKRVKVAETALYELNLAELNHNTAESNHSHFICLGCGKIIETGKFNLKECQRYLSPGDENIQLVECSIRLFGYCSECQANHQTQNNEEE
ncbi:MAG: transcriptional repressor [Halanaerobium sp.]|nr:transcriptional repressor [Halanaerobium sp.]